MFDDNSDFYETLRENVLAHYGTPRHSGRYPWGSGGDPYQNHKDFLGYVDELKKQGLTSTEIVKAFGLKSTTELRAKTAIARNQIRAEDISRATRLKATGMSNVAIGKEMKINESSVRDLLNPGLKARNDVLQTTAGYLKNQLEKHEYLDVGAGTEHYLNGISNDKKNVAIAMLKEEGYKLFYLDVLQQGTGKITKHKILAKPEARFPDLVANQDKIATLTGYSDDGGETIEEIKPPKSVSGSRVAVRYGPDGGANKDGVIELRRNVPDLSLGKARYAQVRIAVDDTHYLKGMAMYTDDLPDGVDMIFNTNKNDTGNKLDAMKELKDDPDMPFGSIVRQKHYTDANGVTQQSPLNIVSDNEEGRWHEWSRTFSSQFTSKQTPKLAREQLDLAYQAKAAEFDEIMQLTNPAVKRKLLEEFTDGVDSATNHLKAAGLPRTRAQVILPINSLKDHEIFAPNFEEGERVVLIRHPHGGRFEIPELTVNNSNREANRVIKQAKDAVGINANVAQRLSGADFDGDTVLVIPNNSGKIKSAPPLEKLKNFDHQKQYEAYDGMRTIDGGTFNAATKKVEFEEGKKSNGARLQAEMGYISNLITDMTIRGATDSELARAVAHSMVVIDSQKHKLNFKQSAIDNDIAGLKTKYQNGPRSGASTLISQAKSETPIPERRPRRVREIVGLDDKGEPIYERTPGPIDPDTGKRVYVPTAGEYIQVKDPATGQKVWQQKPATYTTKDGKVREYVTRVTKMEAHEDAFDLSSGTTMEAVYATHANRLKGLANKARKATLEIQPIKINTSAKAVYAEEVASLNNKLRIAEMNRPLERKAQLVAGVNIKLKMDAYPEMEKSEIKKLRAMELDRARARLGARKQQIRFEDREWEAVQAGAISQNMLSSMLANADMEQVRTLATPRTQLVMTPTKVSQASAMFERGYTAAEIAAKLGVSTSAIYKAIGGTGGESSDEDPLSES